MKTRHLSRMLAVVTALGGGGLLATSANATTVHGAACVADSSSGTLDYDILQGSRNTHSTETMTLMCPAPVANSGSISNVVVRVRDNNSSANLNCRAYRVTANGGFAATGFVSSAGTGIQDVNLGSISTSSSGSFVVRCDAPPSTGIQHFVFSG